MNQFRHTDEQIASALRQAESGRTRADIYCKLGVSEPTVCRQKKLVAGMGKVEIPQPEQLKEEKANQMRPLADLSLDERLRLACHARQCGEDATEYAHAALVDER